MAAIRKTFRLTPSTDAALERLRVLLAADFGHRATWTATLSLAARMAETEVRQRLIARGIDPESVTIPAKSDRSAWLDCAEFFAPDVDDSV